MYYIYSSKFYVENLTFSILGTQKLIFVDNDQIWNSLLIQNENISSFLGVCKVNLLTFLTVSISNRFFFAVV